MKTQRMLNVLSQTTQIGVILLGPEGTLEFVSESAKELITADACENLDDKLASLLNQLSAPIKNLRERAMLEARIDIEHDINITPHRLRIELHAHSKKEWRGCMLILRNLDYIDALDAVLRAASHDHALNILHGGVMHTLRAPLNAMLMNLELFRQSLEKEPQDVQEHLRDQQHHYVEVLVEEVMRMNHLLQSFLDQYAPSSSLKKDLDLAVMLDELIVLFKPQARKQRIDLKTNIDRPLYTHGYAGDIKQALLNILINSLEAMPQGGTLTIAGKCWENLIVVTVCDSGQGIPPALQNKVFTMHFTTKESGTGIGLTMARRAIESHGGTIAVNSSSEKGTCLDIELPVAVIAPFHQ